MQSVDLRPPLLEISVMEHELSWPYELDDDNGMPIDLTGATLIAWAVKVGSSAVTSFTFDRTDDANGSGAMSADLAPGRYQFFFEMLQAGAVTPQTLSRAQLVVTPKPGHP